MRLRLRTRTRERIVQAVVPCFLALCILLGGASSAGHLANLLLQLVAIGILWFALVRPQSAVAPQPVRQLNGLAIGLLALFALQLIPLPPAVWGMLPGREPIIAGYRLLGGDLPWLPLSLAPEQTIASLFWLTPALAILFSMTRLGAFNIRWIARGLIAMAVASVAVGAIQIAGGERSLAYFYSYTNWGVAVGFFANTNHLATTLLMTIPFIAAELARALAGRGTHKQSSAVVMLCAAALMLVVVGLLITRSLAGLGLAIPVGAASALLVLSRHRKPPRWALPAVLVIGAVAIGVAMSEPFGNDLTGEKAQTHSRSRYAMITSTLKAAQDYQPVGSGIGSFLDIYRTREDPGSVGRTYVNHAHSDVAELFLETGIPGVLIMLLFLAWWVSRVIAIWFGRDIDRYAAAATIATGAVIAHSLVDYPLRTAAVSALFAACLAIMAGARARAFARDRTEDQPARHVSA